MTTADPTIVLHDRYPSPIPGLDIKERAGQAFRIHQTQTATRKAAMEQDSRRHRADILADVLNRYMGIRFANAELADTVLIDGVLFTVSDDRGSPHVCAAVPCTRCGKPAMLTALGSTPWIQVGSMLDAAERGEPPLCAGCDHQRRRERQRDAQEPDVSAPSIPEPTVAERLAEALAAFVAHELNERGL